MTSPKLELILSFLLISNMSLWPENVSIEGEHPIVPKGSPETSVQTLSRNRWFIEDFGQYGYLQAPTIPIPDNAFDALAYNTKVNYGYPNTSGFTFGAHIGYALFEHLSAFVGYEYRSFGWQTKNYYSATGAGLTSYYYGVSEGKSRLTSNVLIVGVRPHINLLSGQAYASLGFAAILPYSITGDSDTRLVTVGFSTAGSYKSEIESKYNLSPAILFDIGYQYPISSRIYISMSLTALITSSTNNGKTTEVKTIYPDGRTITSTSAYVDSFSLSDSDKGLNSQGAYIYRYSVIFPNDIGVRVSAGYRFGI